MRRIAVIAIVAAVLTQGCGGAGAVVASAPVSRFIGDWLFGEVLGLTVAAKGDSTDQMLVKQWIDKQYKYVAPHAEEIEGALVGAFSRKDKGEVGFSMTTEDGMEAELKVFERDTVIIYKLVRRPSSDTVEAILTKQKRIKSMLEAIEEAVTKKDKP